MRPGPGRTAARPRRRTSCSPRTRARTRSPQGPPEQSGQARPASEELGPALYTFAAVEGVEPTNDAAERALRHAVCWRKTSYGTDSPSGSRFVERVLTVMASCRQQARDVLEFLTACCRAARDGTGAPSLHPDPAVRAVAE
nr:transposase [Gemmata massiliana]